jgi:gas vesicle protein
MTDNSKGNTGGGIQGPVIGFAVGTLVGGLLGLLLAPASGAKTRRRIAETAHRLGSDARQAVEEAGTTVADAAIDLGADVKNAIGVGIETFRHEGEARDFRTNSRIVQPVQPPGPPAL